MVKFFLRNDKNQPKTSFNNKGLIGNKNNKKTQNKQKSKPKKVLDYRIVIWKKLFTLIKAQHSMMIQKIIRKIKQTKQKIQNLNQLPETQQKNQRVTSLNKQLQKLDHKYQAFKEQKKNDLKLITIYIIVQIFKIQNIDKILEKAKIPKDQFKISELKQKVQNNDAKKLFVQKLSKLTVYQKQLQNCAQLIDVVQQKKLERKTKLKERKIRKYEKQHGIKNSEEPQQDDKQLQKIEQEQNSIQQQQIAQIKHEKKKNIDHSEKKVEKNNFNNSNFKGQKKNFNPSHSDKKDFNHQSKKQNFDRKQNFNKTKPIQKQRTQFKKTGRNKVKFQKEQKRNQFKNNEQNHNQNGQKKQHKKGNPKYDFSKEMAHPSWQAKQELKQQVYIKPFQGKKILL